MLWNSAGSLFNMVCQWAISILIVRLSDAYDAAGIYSLAMSVYAIFSQVAQYRTYAVQVSDVKGEYSAGEYLSFRFLTGLGTFALVLAYSFATCRLSAIPAIALFFLYKFAGLVVDVFHASDQLCHRMDYVGKSLILQGLAALGIFTICFWLTSNLELTLGLMTVATFLICVLYDYPRTSALVPIQMGIEWSRSKQLLIRCAPIVVAGIAASASPSLPRQYLSAVMGDSALGIYASVAAPVAVIQMGVSYIYNPLLSYFSSLFVGNDRGGFCRLLLMTFGGIAILGAICAVGLELFGPWLLSLVYGDSILAYTYLLQPLVLCAVITGITWFINDLLIALRSFESSLVGSVIGLVISLLSMAPFQQLFGLNGVTVTNIVSGLSSVIFMAASLVLRVRGRFSSNSSQ